MKAFLGMDPKKLAIAGMVLAAIFFFFLNILATGEIKTAQLDLTQDKLFTLSDGTKGILKTIDEPLTFRFYYSNKFGEISPLHGNYAKRVQEMLEQIALVHTWTDANRLGPHLDCSKSFVTPGLEQIALVHTWIGANRFCPHLDWRKSLSPKLSNALGVKITP